jgi:hypothetical protein
MRKSCYHQEMIVVDNEKAVIKMHALACKRLPPLALDQGYAGRKIRFGYLSEAAYTVLRMSLFGGLV